MLHKRVTQKLIVIGLGFLFLVGCKPSPMPTSTSILTPSPTPTPIPVSQPDWTSYTTAEGLAGNNVYSIIAVPDGALWFGSPPDGGVSRFQPQK